MSSPRLSSPARYFGAPRSSGTTGDSTGRAVADPRHARLLYDYPDPPPGKLAEGLLQPRPLVLVAPDQGDVLGRVAHAGQLVAQPRLACVLGLHPPDEGKAKEVHSKGAGCRIDDHRDDDVTGDHEVGPEGVHA